MARLERLCNHHWTLPPSWSVQARHLLPGLRAWSCRRNAHAARPRVLPTEGRTVGVAVFDVHSERALVCRHSRESLKAIQKDVDAQVISGRDRTLTPYVSSSEFES